MKKRLRIQRPRKRKAGARLASSAVVRSAGSIERQMRDALAALPDPENDPTVRLAERDYLAAMNEAHRVIALVRSGAMRRSTGARQLAKLAKDREKALAVMDRAWAKARDALREGELDVYAARGLDALEGARLRSRQKRKTKRRRDA